MKQVLIEKNSNKVITVGELLEFSKVPINQNKKTITYGYVTCKKWRDPISDSFFYYLFHPF